MNKYKKMIESAKASGVADESKMWLSIESIGEWLEELEEEHPKLYKKMMQEQHVILFGKHFDKGTALELVETMYHTDKNGNVHEGEYFTMEQAKIVRDKHLQDANVCDVYVALNATYHDWHCFFVFWQNYFSKLLFVFFYILLKSKHKSFCMFCIHNHP
jgi:hypothetical protein